MSDDELEVVKNYRESVIRHMKVQLPDECPVCEQEFEWGGWGVIHGRCVCRECGLGLQARPLSDEDWDDVPRFVAGEDDLEMLKEYYHETGQPSFTIRDAPISDRQKRDFNEWLEAREDGGGESA